MLPPIVKGILVVVTVISVVISYVAAYARWYRDCIHIKKSTGYWIIFLPLFLGIAVTWGVFSGAIPEDMKEEAFALPALISSVILVFTVFRQLTGQCKSGGGMVQEGEQYPLMSQQQQPPMMQQQQPMMQQQQPMMQQQQPMMQQQQPMMQQQMPGQMMPS